MESIAELDRRFYADRADEHLMFDRMIDPSLGSRSTVLDAGAGRGLMFPYDHRNRVARLIGVDLDPAVAHNPNVTDAVIADLERIPVRDGTFDLAFSKNVFEHLEHPVAVLRELHRVLKPGAHLLIHTPNRWHYVTLVSALTPARFHVWYRGKLGWGEPSDTFPTRYRANDVRTIERSAVRSGFHVRSIVRFEGPPSYLAWHPLAYRLGIAYERLVNRFEALAPFRVNLLIHLEASDH